MLGFAFSLALFTPFFPLSSGKKWSHLFKKSFCAYVLLSLNTKLGLKESKCGALFAQMELNKFNLITKDFKRVRLLKSKIHNDKIVLAGLNQAVPFSMRYFIPVWKSHNWSV